MAKASTARVQIAENISITQRQHDKLREHLKDRLDFCSEIRDPMVEHFEVQDKYIAGYIIRSEDDKKRELDNQKGKKVKPIDQNLQLVAAQMDEAVTYISSILFPDGGMYGAITNREQQAKAQGMARLMNNHARRFNHYTESCKALYNLLCRNFGGVIIEWDNIRGPKPLDVGIGGIGFKDDIIFMGNRVDAIDPYNFLWDPSIHPCELHTRGEWFAVPEVHTKFRVKKMQAEGELFNVDMLLRDATAPETVYYKSRPILANRRSSSTQVDWFNVLTAGTRRAVGSGYEIVNVYIWLTPKDFGLSNSKALEIWRISLANGLYICNATKLDSAHGMLPVAVGMPLDTGMGLQEPSFADRLLPLQHFASFLLNTHQDANRKALHGTVWYDESLAGLTDQADPVSAKIPVKGLAQSKKSIRDVVHTSYDAPQTQYTMNDIEAVNSLMQKILPTDALRQVANLERATQYQAAATMQSVHARNRKLAKLCDEQVFSKCREMQFYNNLQYVQEVEIISDEDGQQKPIPITEYIDFNIDALASDSLQGADKLIIVEMLRDIINMAIQSQVAIQKIDIIALIDYFTDVMGDKTDFKQFEIKTEFDRLTPEQKQMAFQLFMQASQAGAAPPDNGAQAMANLPGAAM